MTDASSAATFRAGCARGELLYQRCAACGAVQLHTRQRCGHCHAASLDWLASRRRGIVYSHTTVQRAPSAAFRTRVPYVIALVDVDEGFRLMLNVVDCAPAAVAIGAPVRIEMRDGLDGAPWPHAVLDVARGD